MLATKGLRLGQYASERPITEAFEPEPLSPDEQAVLPPDLRAEPLGPGTEVHDPPGHQHAGRPGPPHRRRSAGVQEFGVTSLNEVREKLTALGLKLRGE